MAFGQNTVAFASAGSVFGPWGTGIGALIGLGFDLFGSTQDSQATAYQREAEALQYKTSALQTGIQIDQTKADISAYENYLAAFPNYADLTKSNFEAQSKQEFGSLMKNYAMQNVAAGATGRVGGSAGMVAESAKQDLTAFAGADMSLYGNDGGTYQQAKTEMLTSLDTTQKQYQSQLDIFKTSLPVLTETKALYESAAAKATDAAASAKRAADTWWNPFD